MWILTQVSETTWTKNLFKAKISNLIEGVLKTQRAQARPRIFTLSLTHTSNSSKYQFTREERKKIMNKERVMKLLTPSASQNIPRNQDEVLMKPQSSLKTQILYLFPSKNLQKIVMIEWVIYGCKLFLQLFLNKWRNEQTQYIKDLTLKTAQLQTKSMEFQ